MPTTQTVHIQTYDYGASLSSATLRVVSTDVLVATADTVNEVTADSGLYAAVFGELSVIAAGEYRLRAVVSGKPINRYVTLAGTDGEIVEARNERLAVLDSASIRSALGMSAADLDSQLDTILAAASAGAGTGARTVTITVNDGTDVLQNAIVRFTEGSNTFRAVTNASGVAVFNLDDATYTVAVTKSGYTYAGTTMVVNGTETATYSMIATSVTPPTNPDLSAVEVLCLDEDFAAVAGVDVDFRMAAVASGDQNRAHPGAKKTITSNVSGIARFEGPQGATIEWKRGTGQQWTAVTLDNDSVTNVTSLIGSP